MVGEAVNCQFEFDIHESKKRPISKILFLFAKSQSLFSYNTYIKAWSRRILTGNISKPTYYQNAFHLQTRPLASPVPLVV
jgi:hypothetical protein